jgi:hypothetical protein
MSDERTFAVTLVRVGPGLPYFEVAAYRYTGAWLPVVGDIITITPATSRVTEAVAVTSTSPDDFIVAA